MRLFVTPWIITTRLLCPWDSPGKTVAISFSRESSWPGNQICISCIASWFFTTEPPGKPPPTDYVPALMDWTESRCLCWWVAEWRLGLSSDSRPSVSQKQDVITNRACGFPSAVFFFLCEQNQPSLFIFNFSSHTFSKIHWKNNIINSHYPPFQ